MKNLHQSSVSRRLLIQGGFTLVELMIGITLSMFIVLALTTLLININRNNTELARTNSLIENGRFALQLLESDLSHAGFWGGYVPKFDDLTLTTAPNDSPAGFATNSVPDPCLAYASWDSAADPSYLNYKAKLVGIPVQPYQLPTSGSAPVCSTKVSNFKTSTNGVAVNSDMLVVRHVAPCAATSAANDEDCKRVAGNLYFQSDRCNATSSYQFEAANSINMTSSSGYVLPSNFTLKNRACGTDYGAIYKFTSHLYYVRDYSVALGDNIPTLMRSNFGLSGGLLQHMSADALIEGVEAFRVELGVDSKSKSNTTLTATDFNSTISWASTSNQNTPQNRGDGNADGYMHCGSASCTSLELMSAVSAKVYVLVRAQTATPGYQDKKTYALGSTTFGPFNDSYKRHVFTRTVRLTNISMRREVPPV